MQRVCKILEQETVTDFVDLNCGCPIDILCNHGCGAALMNKPNKLVEMVNVMKRELVSKAITVKLRIGWDEKSPNIQRIVPMLQDVSQGRLAAIMVSCCGYRKWVYIFDYVYIDSWSFSLAKIFQVG